MGLLKAHTQGVAEIVDPSFHPLLPGHLTLASKLDPLASKLDPQAPLTRLQLQSHVSFPSQATQPSTE